MALPQVGDRVSLNGKDFIVSHMDEDAGTASLTAGDDVVEDVPVESLSAEDEAREEAEE